jgi:hypothetical protein
LADVLGSKGLAHAHENYSEEAALVRAEELVERLLRIGRRAETVKMTETAL